MLLPEIPCYVESEKRETFAILLWMEAQPKIKDKENIFKAQKNSGLGESNRLLW